MTTTPKLVCIYLAGCWLGLHHVKPLASRIASCLSYKRGQHCLASIPMAHPHFVLKACRFKVNHAGRRRQEKKAIHASFENVPILKWAISYSRILLPTEGLDSSSPHHHQMVYQNVLMYTE